MLTVTTAAEDRSLLTIADLQAITGSEDVEALDDLNERVASALAGPKACAIAKAGTTPATFRLEVLSETFRLYRPQQSLILSRAPVVEIASVTEAGVALSTDEWEREDGILYRLVDADCRTTWPADTRIVVAYTAGWDVVPDNLKTAAMKLARIFWAEDGDGAREPGVKRIRTEGLDEIEYWVPPASDPLLSQEIADLLVEYKNW